MDVTSSTSFLMGVSLRVTLVVALAVFASIFACARLCDIMHVPKVMSLCHMIGEALLKQSCYCQIFNHLFGSA